MSHPWTDLELDTALEELHQAPGLAAADLAAQRSALLQLIDDQQTPRTAVRTLPSRRNTMAAGRLPRYLTVAAVIVLGALFVPTLITHDGQPVSSAAAATVFTRAADAITTSDPVVPEGSYRQVSTHSWTTAVTGPYAYLAETVITEWVPADSASPAKPWLLRHVDTNNRRWLVGTAKEAAAAGMTPTASTATTDYSGACGDFAGDAGGCNRAGSWQDPSPRFLSDLPRDTDQLRARLSAAAPPDSGAAGMFNYALDTLRSGSVPADLRAALYRVMSTLPGIVVTEGVINLDGRAGTALGIQGPGIRQDVILDPSTGEFIGSRSVQTEHSDGIPAGTTVGWTAVQTKVVANRG